MMVTGITVQSSKEALRLTRLYPGMLYSTAGNSFYVVKYLFIYLANFLLELHWGPILSWLEHLKLQKFLIYKSIILNKY